MRPNRRTAGQATAKLTGSSPRGAGTVRTAAGSATPPPTHSRADIIGGVIVTSMDLTPYVETMRSHLLTAAAMGDEQARETARRLADALEPGARLALTNALSAFAAEVTAAWGAGSVEIRMRGGEPEVVVTTETIASAAADESFINIEADGEAGAARVSLRMPEAVKSAAETRANESALSLNAWLTRTIAGALSRVPPPPGSPGPPPLPGRRLSGYHRS